MKGDLLEILSSWPENATENRMKAKVALACCKIVCAIFISEYMLTNKQ